MQGPFHHLPPTIRLGSENEPRALLGGPHRQARRLEKRIPAEVQRVRLCPTPNAMDSLYNSPMRAQAGPPPFISSLFFRIHALHLLSVFPHSRSILYSPAFCVWFSTPRRRTPPSGSSGSKGSTLRGRPAQLQYSTGRGRGKGREGGGRPASPREGEYGRGTRMGKGREGGGGG